MFKRLKEKWLVQQFLLTRNEIAFNQLYKRHQQAMFSMAMQLTGGDEKASSELIQETWLRAIEKLDTFKWKCELRTWLIAILINCGKEYYRKKELFDTTTDESLPEIQVRDFENSIDISKALSVLPPGYRMVIILHDVQGYKHTEISQLLNISEGTSKSQLFNARKHLKKILQ